MNQCSTGLLSAQKVTPSPSKSAGLPRGKNNSGSPNTMEDRSTGGLALPAVPPATAREQPARFAPTGCSVRLSHLKLPPLGIPPAFGRRGMSIPWSLLSLS